MKFERFSTRCQNHERSNNKGRQLCLSSSCHILIEGFSVHRHHFCICGRNPIIAHFLQHISNMHTCIRTHMQSIVKLLCIRMLIHASTSHTLISFCRNKLSTQSADRSFLTKPDVSIGRNWIYLLLQTKNLKVTYLQIFYFRKISV